MTPFDAAVDAELAELRAAHLLRHTRRIDSPCGPTIMIGTRPVILMASNDYLGLANDPALKQAAIDATITYGVGAGAARLISGTQPPHEALESALASFKGTEAALCFGSGYLANLGWLASLAKAGDLVLADRLCHASLIDGCRLSQATLRVYHHNDPTHLERQLQRRRTARRTLIVTDGLFSMDGDLAPLQALAELSQRYEALLLVDDAHGTGVLGAEGRGSLEACGVEHLVPFHMGTLGKALGASGAYVAGTKGFIQLLMNRARPFLFTTAPPAAQSAAALAGLRIVQEEPARRARLWANQAHLCHGLTEAGFHLSSRSSPILPILIGDAAQALTFAAQLLEEGVMAPAIRPPTVPRGSSRIRLTVTAAHSPTQIDQVLQACVRVGRALRVI